MLERENNELSNRVERLESDLKDVEDKLKSGDTQLFLHYFN